MTQKKIYEFDEKKKIPSELLPEAEPLDIEDVLGKEMVVIQAKQHELPYQGVVQHLTEYLVELDGKDSIFFTWSTVLFDQFSRMEAAGETPFRAKLMREKSQGKTYYTFKAV